MKPFDPHKISQELRRFKPSRKPAGVFTLSIALSDAALLTLAFFIAISPFVLQPGINISLPESSFTGGARFNSMVLSITRGGWFYFNDVRLSEGSLPIELERAAKNNPEAVLIIEADEHVSHGTVIAAWNAALAAGISEVSIATEISEASEALR